MRRALLASLLLALGFGHAAAWDCPGGMKGSDQITAYSQFFGVSSESKPLKYLDMVPAWKKLGPITKVNLYYSWSHSCLEGVKVTFGYDARTAQRLGTEKDLSEKHLALGPYEIINKVEVRQNAKSGCVQWIKIYSNSTASLALGAEEGAGPLLTATANRKAGFLAAVRGYEDYYPGKAVTQGGLQKLQFVWGVSVCPPGPVPPPKPAPPPPSAPVVPQEKPAVPIEGPPEPEPEPPTPAPPAEPVCPAKKSMCDTAAVSGPASCPYLAPFVSNACVGGCCVSAGKCRKGFCGSVGLGAEVMAKDLVCWGTNSGPIHKLNRCRNLACKLAVPGCVTDLISGSCVGTVAALSRDDVDPGARQWVGAPCLQTVPGGPPVDALGNIDVSGAYAAKLWSICDCNATKSLWGYSPSTCKGPLCELFKKPDLPSFNFARPSFGLPDLGKLIGGAKPFDLDLPHLLTNLSSTLTHATPVADLSALLGQLKSNLPSGVPIPDLSALAAHLTDLKSNLPSGVPIPDLSALAAHLTELKANLTALPQGIAGVPDLAALSAHLAELKAFVNASATAAAAPIKAALAQALAQAPALAGGLALNTTVPGLGTVTLPLKDLLPGLDVPSLVAKAAALKGVDLSPFLDGRFTPADVKAAESLLRALNITG